MIACTTEKTILFFIWKKIIQSQEFLINLIEPQKNILCFILFYFQLRYLQTLNGISAENNSTIIFPVPIDIMSSFMQVCLILSPLFIFNHLSAVQHRPNHSKYQTARDVSKLSSASTADVWIPCAKCKCFSKGKDKWIRTHIIAFPMIINHWNKC